MNDESDVAQMEIEAQLALIMERAKRGNHIFCDCNPTVMFCGAHISVPKGGDTYEMPDGDECPGCYLVWLSRYCPYCGHHWTPEDYYDYDFGNEK